MFLEELMPLRRIPFEKIENFRDLGGYASSYGETSFNVIYRSGYLGDASSKDIQTIKALGIKTVLDLREEKERLRQPDVTKNDPSFTSVEISVNGRIPQDHEDMVNSYVENLSDFKAAREVFLNIATCEKPMVLHCTAGKDRTGAFIAILLLANGVPFHDVNGDYMLSFPYLTRMTKETFKSMPDFPKALLTPNQFFLVEVMEKFNALFGSIDHYFEILGLDDETITLLKNVLGKQEMSCGALVFNKEKILLEHMNQGHYSLPKGHIEDKDGSLKGTAIREIKEEVGLDISFFGDEFVDTVYSPKPGVAKRVRFFLASTDSPLLSLQKSEIQDAYWLEPSDVLKCISHDSERAAFQKAYKLYISKYRK